MNKELKLKYADYRKLSIDDYLEEKSKKLNTSYNWKIDKSSTLLRIYRTDTIEDQPVVKLTADVRLHAIKNDLYYVAFDQNKILCSVNWFV